MNPIKIAIPTAMLGLALALPAFAQAPSPSASDSMNQAGQDVKEAGSDIGSAAKNVGKGTATAVHDTKITAKIKTALHTDDATKGQKIHVSTSAGVVTLKGKVASADVAARAEQIAQGTEGVKSVDNELAVASSASSNMQ
jgi:hyperosmotically inducible protein